MEMGLFLPLDEYMENNTQFTEWDKLTQSVMAAGRNENGQQIIPVSYTLPLLCYPKEQVDYTPPHEMCWDDMLNDPELAPIAHDLAYCYGWEPDIDGLNGVTRYYMEYVLGEIYDFENETLSFTEDELLQRVNEILELGTEDVNSNLSDKYSGAIEEWLGWGISNNYFNKPLTLIPMYSDDGGVTANIEAYAAINRNTKHADEAFTAIDVLMSRNVQQRNQMYTMYFANFAKFPMHEELFRENTDLANQYMTEENFNELCEVRDQITVANFGGRQREVLNEMLIHCRAARENNESIEEIVHEAYADLERRVKE